MAAGIVATISASAKKLAKKARKVARKARKSAKTALREAHTIRVFCEAGVIGQLIEFDSGDLHVVAAAPG